MLYYIKKYIWDNGTTSYNIRNYIWKCAGVHITSKIKYHVRDQFLYNYRHIANLYPDSEWDTIGLVTTSFKGSFLINIRDTIKSIYASNKQKELLLKELLK